jgi:SAM-dependent methyltransferase
MDLKQKKSIQRQRKRKVSISNQRGVVLETGAWVISNKEAEQQHEFDPGLAVGLVRLIKKIGYKETEKVYDLGCGKGDYVKYMRSEGLDAKGFDGNPNTPKFCKECVVHDLTEKLKVPSAEFVISLEVAEHIPKDKEELYINTLNEAVKEGGYLIISWAYPGQGGFGHFNELDNAYAKKLFLKMGYQNMQDMEKYLRIRSSLKWFKYTIMVFHKINPSQISKSMIEPIILLNEEANNRMMEKKLKKEKPEIRFFDKEPLTKIMIKDMEDLDIQEKIQFNHYLKTIYYDESIELNIPIQNFPKIDKINELKENQDYQKIKKSIIKNLVVNEDLFIQSFPKDFRDFIYLKKTLFMQNLVYYALLWYMIFFTGIDMKDSTYYHLYIEIYKNKNKYLQTKMEIMEKMNGFCDFFLHVLCDSYMVRGNTHWYLLMKNMNKSLLFYKESNEFHMKDNIKDHVYTKILIDFKAYGFDPSGKFNEEYMNRFLKHVNDMIDLYSSLFHQQRSIL